MTRYHIAIDERECIGYGRCAELAARVFELRDGIAAAVVAETDDASVLDAAAECPMSAIRVGEVKAA